MSDPRASAAPGAPGIDPTWSSRKTRSSRSPATDSSCGSLAGADGASRPIVWRTQQPRTVGVSRSRATCLWRGPAPPSTCGRSNSVAAAHPLHSSRSSAVTLHRIGDRGPPGVAGRAEGRADPPRTVGRPGRKAAPLRSLHAGRAGAGGAQLRLVPPRACGSERRPPGCDPIPRQECVERRRSSGPATPCLEPTPGTATPIGTGRAHAGPVHARARLAGASMYGSGRFWRTIVRLPPGPGREPLGHGGADGHSPEVARFEQRIATHRTGHPPRVAAARSCTAQDRRGASPAVKRGHRGRGRRDVRSPAPLADTWCWAGVPFSTTSAPATSRPVGRGSEAPGSSCGRPAARPLRRGRGPDGDYFALPPVAGRARSIAPGRRGGAGTQVVDGVAHGHATRSAVRARQPGDHAEAPIRGLGARRSLARPDGPTARRARARAAGRGS